MRSKSAIFLQAIVAVLLVCVSRPAAAQQLDDSCTVSVLNRNVRVNADGSWILPNIPANFGPVRARVTCIVDGRTISGESDPFVIPSNGVVDVPRIQFRPPTPIPTNIAITAAPDRILTVIGATAQLTVTARYADQTTRDVTAASTGTQYTVSNPAIA